MQWKLFISIFFFVRFFFPGRKKGKKVKTTKRTTIQINKTRKTTITRRVLVEEIKNAVKFEEIKNIPNLSKCSTSSGKKNNNTSNQVYFVLTELIRKYFG